MKLGKGSNESAVATMMRVTGTKINPPTKNVAMIASGANGDSLMRLVQPVMVSRLIQSASGVQRQAAANPNKHKSRIMLRSNQWSAEARTSSGTNSATSFSGSTG